MNSKRHLPKGKARQYLTPNEVAEMMMVSPVTVRQWASKGELPALTTPGGHRRFVRQDVELFAKKRGLTFLPMTTSEMRILIVDDDHQFSDYLKEMLTLASSDVKVELAYDGFEAGQKIETFQPNIVLLDLMMPGLDGYEVCHRIKEDPRTKSIRIIAMTGYPTEENKEHIMSEGAEVCLAKPLKREQLLDLLGLGQARPMQSKLEQL